MSKNLFRSSLLIMVCLYLSACSSATPSKETVAASLKSIMPANYEVVSVAQLKDMPGLIEVAVKMDKQPVVLYLDKKAQYVLSGNLLELKTKKNLTIEAQSKIK